MRKCRDLIAVSVLRREDGFWFRMFWGLPKERDKNPIYINLVYKPTEVIYVANTKDLEDLAIGQL